MSFKVMAPELVLLQYYPKLKGCVQDGGWVTLHNVSFNSQRTSIEALNHLHRQGFKFDIETNNGKILENVNINDAHIRLEYNVMSSIDTYPDNGVHCWRLSSNVGAMPPEPVSSFVDIKTGDPDVVAIPDIFIEGTLIKPGSAAQAELYKASLEPAVGPHYSNDKYKREIKPGVFVDVYDVIDCFEVSSGALQHAVKKLLAAGKRGHKDYEQDLIDILSSVERALFQHQEKNK